jgi:hypothetical protein
MIPTFRQWVLLKEAEEEQPNYVKTLGSALKIDPMSLIGLSVPFTGVIGNKRYNLVYLTIEEFDDYTNPKRAKIKIGGQNPHMAQQVQFNKSKDDEDLEATPDDDQIIDLSIDELNQVLGQGWQPAMNQNNPLGV